MTFFVARVKVFFYFLLGWHPSHSHPSMKEPSMGSLGGAGNLHFKQTPLFSGNNKAVLPHPLHLPSLTPLIVMPKYSPSEAVCQGTL